MKYVKKIVILAILWVPLVSFASVTHVSNVINVTSTSGGVHADGERGQDGVSVSMSVQGQDGEDGAVGKSGTVIEGKSSSRIDIYTEVDGKVVEDVHISTTTSAVISTTTHSSFKTEKQVHAAVQAVTELEVKNMLQILQGIFGRYSIISQWIFPNSFIYETNKF